MRKQITFRGENIQSLNKEDLLECIEICVEERDAFQKLYYNEIKDLKAKVICK